MRNDPNTMPRDPSDGVMSAAGQHRQTDSGLSLIAPQWVVPAILAVPSRFRSINHPTPKLLDALGAQMRQHAVRGGLCCRQFSGYGSQLMAGEAAVRRVFAMKIRPAYIDVAIERWPAVTGREAILSCG
jgi:DNA modification methylase